MPKIWRSIWAVFPSAESVPRRSARSSSTSCSAPGVRPKFLSPDPFRLSLRQAACDQAGRLGRPERLRQAMAIDQGPGLGLGLFEIAGRQDQDDVGQELIEPDGELGSVRTARHAHVANDDVDL